MQLILPGDPAFYATLASPPPGWQQDLPLVADHESGVLRTTTLGSFKEYVLGGEYEARLSFMGDDLEDDEGFSIIPDDLEGIEEIYIDF